MCVLALAYTANSAVSKRQIDLLIGLKGSGCFLNLCPDIWPILWEQDRVETATNKVGTEDFKWKNAWEALALSSAWRSFDTSASFFVNNFNNGIDIA